MSSRLFQEIREKRGLAYSVYSYTTQYADTGLFGVYAGCLPGKVDQVLDLCRAELARVAAARASPPRSSRRGKGQLRGSFVLGLEDTGSRMSRIGKGELVYGELLSVDESLGRIDAVTLDEVRDVAAELLAQPPSLVVIGPFDDDRDVLRRRRLTRAPRGAALRGCARHDDCHRLIRVGVVGAQGRMGAEVCRAVEAADGPRARRRASTSGDPRRR